MHAERRATTRARVTVVTTPEEVAVSVVADAPPGTLAKSPDITGYESGAVSEG